MMKIDVPAAESYRLFDLAVEVTAKGQLEAGIAQWKKVLEMDPGNAKALNNLGYALSQQGNLAEGLTQFQKALEVDPDFSLAQNNLGTGLLYEDKLDEAIPHLQRAMELNPAYAKTYETFISSLDWPANPPPADLRPEDAVRPKAEEATVENASWQKRERLDAQYQGSLDAVLADIMESDDPPRRAEIEKLIADLDIPQLRTLAEQEKNFDERFAAQRQILRIFLHTFEASRHLLAQKRNAQALTCLEIAAQAAPRNPYISYNLARAQALNSQEEKALRTLRAAVEKGFNDPDRVEGEPAFEGLRTEADYQKALAKMREGKPQPEAAP
jgi:tetratricopeptide (TPR) repeat protein